MGIREKGRYIYMNSVNIRKRIERIVEWPKRAYSTFSSTTSGEGNITWRSCLNINGAVKAETGKYTGRSPKDKYMVEEDSSKDKIDWGQ